MDAFAALAEPRRREILRLVSAAELSAGEIARRFEVTRPAISQHIRVLREAGLVSERSNGTRRLYPARPETLAELRASIETVWGESPCSLMTAAEQEGRQRRRKRQN